MNDLWLWLASDAPNGWPVWLNVLVMGPIALGMATLLVWAKVDEWRHPRRRQGFWVEVQCAEYARAAREGRMSKPEALEAVTVTRCGAFSPEHLRLRNSRPRSDEPTGRSGSR